MVKEFFKTYGYSFALLIGFGAIIAFFLEATVKKAYEWLLPKFNEKGQKILAIVKIVLILVLSSLLSIYAAKIAVKNMPFPGNGAFIVFWIALVYVSQYVFSLYGLKGFLDWWKEHHKKEAEVEQKKSDECPILGMKRLKENLNTDGKGNYFNDAGQRV